MSSRVSSAILDISEYAIGRLGRCESVQNREGGFRRGGHEAPDALHGGLAIFDCKYRPRGARHLYGVASIKMSNLTCMIRNSLRLARLDPITQFLTQTCLPGLRRNQHLDQLPIF